MEKKEYIKPFIEIILLDEDDIVTASNVFDPNGDLNPDAEDWFG